MTALLGKARIVGDPGLDLALAFDQGKNLAAYPGQQSAVRSFALGHETMQHLMAGLDPRRRDSGRSRLAALTSPRR